MAGGSSSREHGGCDEEQGIEKPSSVRQHFFVEGLCVVHVGQIRQLAPSRACAPAAAIVIVSTRICLGDCVCFFAC
mgnify:CR=1 FL=1